MEAQKKQFKIEKNNTGVVWKNIPRDGKVLAENAPNYKGYVLVEGVDKEVSIWVNRTDDGEIKNLSLVFQDPYVPKATSPTSYATKPKPMRDDV
jgi:hypothetical protein